MPGLQKVAAALVAPGKGILAADASIATMSRRLEAVGAAPAAQGLDGLRSRLAGCRELGAVFAKWRAVLNITRERPRVRMRGASAAGSPDCAQPLPNERQAGRA